MPVQQQLQPVDVTLLGTDEVQLLVAIMHICQLLNRLHPSLPRDQVHLPCTGRTLSAQTTCRPEQLSCPRDLLGQAYIILGWIFQAWRAAE